MSTFLFRCLLFFIVLEIKRRSNHCCWQYQLIASGSFEHFVTDARNFHNCFINFILVFKLTLRRMSANIWSSEDLAKDAKKELGEDAIRTKVYYSYKNWYCIESLSPEYILISYSRSFLKEFCTCLCNNPITALFFQS